MVPNIVDAIFGQILTAVCDEIKKANSFQPLFERLESKLKEIRPVINEIERQDRLLGRSEDYMAMITSKLQEGLDLARECTKVWTWDYIRKKTYAKRLEEFENSLLQWANINLQLRLVRESSEILLTLKTNREGGDDENKFVGGCGAPAGPDFLLGLDELELKGKPLDGGCGAPVGPDFLMGLDELELKGKLLDGGCGAPGAPDFLVGLDELKARLLDGGGERVVVLSAPGGCGKTTLAKKLCRDEEIKGIFKDNIFFITFSKTPNLMVIVRELFQHMGYRVPEFQSDEDATKKLELKLKQLEADRILLVLDNVWPESESLIEALEFNIPGYQILVTSRSKIDGFSNYEMKLLDDQIRVTKRETSMVVPNFVDDAVGAVFSELLTAVLHEIEKAKNFKSIFKRIESTLRRIEPVIVEIEKLDRRLDRSDDEIAALTRQLQRGLDLVLKCAKIRRSDFLKKNRCAKKLEEFERSLLQWAQIDVQLHLRRDSSKLLQMFDTNRKGAMGVVWDDRIEFVGGCRAPGAPDFLVGLDEPLRELKAKLLDGGGEQVVVLSAPGGYGKTTLAKKLCSDEEIKGIFKDSIFFVTFSKTPNLMVIVRELFQHMGFRVPELQTDEDATKKLELMLTQLEGDHILLVLDDVWPESESLLEALGFNIPGYKILATSRSKMSGFSNYELKLLDDRDAMSLFHHHSAFPQDGNSCIPDDLVKRIVKGCGGLPLPLTLVGRSLRGRHVSVWNNISQWSAGDSII